MDKQTDGQLGETNRHTDNRQMKTGIKTDR